MDPCLGCGPALPSLLHRIILNTKKGDAPAVEEQEEGEPPRKRRRKLRRRAQIQAETPPAQIPVAAEAPTQTPKQKLQVKLCFARTGHGRRNACATGGSLRSINRYRSGLIKNWKSGLGP